MFCNINLRSSNSRNCGTLNSSNDQVFPTEPKAPRGPHGGGGLEASQRPQSCRAGTRSTCRARDSLQCNAERLGAPDRLKRSKSALRVGSESDLNATSVSLRLWIENLVISMTLRVPGESGPLGPEPLGVTLSREPKWVTLALHLHGTA
jgi:hypothetical protein